MAVVEIRSAGLTLMGIAFVVVVTYLEVDGSK
jgi:hypothetical protein